jgi:competence protein ComK
MYLSEYEINENTYAIIYIEEDVSKVIEKTNEVLVNLSPNKIVENSCEYFGSTLSGRQKGSYSLINITHKVPVIIEESKEIIFFPTVSPRLKDCSWISIKNITDYYEKDDKVFINFEKNKTIDLDLSYNIISNQILRASRLESVLRKRKN